MKSSFRPFKEYEVSEHIIKFPPEVLKFMEEGNVIPHGNGTWYFMPFTFIRLRDSDLFQVVPLSHPELTPEKIALPTWKRLSEKEWERYTATVSDSPQ